MVTTASYSHVLADADVRERAHPVEDERPPRPKGRALALADADVEFGLVGKSWLADAAAFGEKQK